MEPFTQGKFEISMLYVEDDPVARNVIATMIPLKFPGLKLISAENGQIGLGLFKEHRPEIVITDISMPVMDGMLMAKAIRALDPHANIIVISSHNDTQFMLDAIKINISRYVLKPIDHKQLFEAIDDCFARISLERQVNKQNEHIGMLSRALERSASIVVITDAAGAIEYVNPKFTEITGYAGSEVIGQNPRILKSGGAAESYKSLWETIRAGKEWHGEFLNRKKGGELYWESASISPILDERGIITHFVAVKEEITERKKREGEILKFNEELEVRVKERTVEYESVNKELESFCYSVSHDMRAPLRHIEAYTRIFLEDYGATISHDGQEYLEKICKATKRMGDLIEDLLNLSRITRSNISVENIDLSQMAQEILVELLAAFPERRATFTITPGIGVRGDAKMLRIVMENLIYNAWKYTGKKELAEIDFGATEMNGESVYYVHDNGAGFDMGYSDKLYGVFQRLHKIDEYEGTGVGLATVKRIIQRHGGETWAEGKVDEGATFYFTINC